jgi:hypothetical protein
MKVYSVILDVNEFLRSKRFGYISKMVEPTGIRQLEISL